MTPLTVMRALVRDRASLFQSFAQPVLLLWILTTSLGGSFASSLSESASTRSLYLNFAASDFYAVVVLLVTILVASQYATDLAVQCSGPGSVFRPRAQYRTPVRATLATATGIVLLAASSITFFILSSTIFPGVSWPWSAPGFWILIAGLILLSVFGGFAAGLATLDQGFADLLISVLVFASALLAGAFYPYPATSRMWVLAPYSPFTPLLTQILALVSGEESGSGTLSFVVWACALGLVGVVTVQLRRRYDSSAAGRQPRRAIAWVSRKRPVFVCSAGIVVLPLAVWLAGPLGFVPSSADSTGLMYPYAGLTTVLLLLLNMLLVAHCTDGPPHVCRMRSFRVRLLATRGTLGAGLILTSLSIAAVLWHTPFSTLVRTALALGLFHVWSLLLMLLIADVSRDRPVYWATAVSLTLLISFLGGSFFSPSLPDPIGPIASYILPNGLLLHRAAGIGLPVVLVQIAAFLTLLLGGLPRVSHRGVQREIPRNRRDTGTAPPTASPPSRQPQPTERSPAGMVDSIALRERKRILDEVHDTLGHGITGALWQIRSARGMTDDPALQETLDRAAYGLEQGLSRIRRYLRDSAPRASRDWSELYTTVEQFSHCPVELSLLGDSGSFHPVVVQRFTQTVQELLTNALRYGEPTMIRVELNRTARIHRLEYREYGRGWGSAGPRMGYGLSTIHALFTEIGGSFHLDGLPDASGIQAVAIVPTRETHNHESR